MDSIIHREGEEITPSAKWYQIRDDHPGLEILEDPSYEEWFDALRLWQKVENLSAWVVADLLAYGDWAFGEMYTQAMNITELSYGTLANRVYVAKAIAPERRVESVSFSHHAEVASVPPTEQKRFLDLAKDKDLSRDELRVEVQAWKRGKSVDISEKPTHYDMLLDAVTYYCRIKEKGENHDEIERAYNAMRHLVRSRI